MLLCTVLLAIVLIIVKLDAVLRIQDEKREEKQMRMRDGSGIKTLAEDKDEKERRTTSRPNPKHLWRFMI